jgi:PilZ domain
MANRRKGERRANNRYSVHSPVQFRAPGTAPGCGWGSGRTVDMSARGILIDAPEPLPLGSAVELALEWPGIYHGTPMMRLFLTASVVRVDSRGTALRILTHQFVDPGAKMVGGRRPAKALAVA